MAADAELEELLDVLDRAATTVCRRLGDYGWAGQLAAKMLVDLELDRRAVIDLMAPPSEPAAARAITTRWEETAAHA